MQIEDMNGKKLEFDTMNVPANATSIDGDGFAVVANEQAKVRAAMEAETIREKAAALGMTEEEFRRRMDSVIMEFGDPAGWGHAVGAGVAAGMSTKGRKPKVVKRWKPAKQNPSARRR